MKKELKMEAEEKAEQEAWKGCLFEPVLLVDSWRPVGPPATFSPTFDPNSSLLFSPFLSFSSISLRSVVGRSLSFSFSTLERLCFDLEHLCLDTPRQMEQPFLCFEVTPLDNLYGPRNCRYVMVQLPKKAPDRPTSKLVTLILTLTG